MRPAGLAGACALMLVAAGCTREAADAPGPAAGPDLEVQGSLNQVMRGILFPNSNIIFDAQDRDPAAEPAPDDPLAPAHPFAGTYGGWQAVENAAIALGESANLIVLPGRTCENGKPVPLDDEVYRKGVEGLRQIAGETLKTAQARNMDAMLDIADRLTQACAYCHDVYRDRIVDGKPIGIADRCEPAAPAGEA
jgi:hypothetical protein